LGVSGKVGTVMIAITGSFFLVSELVRRRRGRGWMMVLGMEMRDN